MYVRKDSGGGEGRLKVTQMEELKNVAFTLRDLRQQTRGWQGGGGGRYQTPNTLKFSVISRVMEYFFQQLSITQKEASKSSDLRFSVLRLIFFNYFQLDNTLLYVLLSYMSYRTVGHIVP